MQPRFWRLAWKKGILTPLLSTLRSSPSMRQCGAEKWISSLAGFPCQPFSVAGKRQHELDERHVWPQIARIIGECNPAFVFLENVNVRAFADPWRDLRGLGFNLSRPYACTAAELGAPHIRRRVFALAYSAGVRLQSRRFCRESRTGAALAVGAWE